jgi:hypothetical protein
LECEPETLGSSLTECSKRIRGSQRNALFELLALVLVSTALEKSAWPRISEFEKDGVDAKKSSRSAVMLERADDSDGSTGERPVGKKPDASAGLDGPGEGSTTAGVGRYSALEVAVVLEANQLLNEGIGATLIVPWVAVGALLLLGTLLLAVLLNLLLLSGFRPTRLVTKYSQTRPRFAHREHVGFSLWHFTLEEAQAWQLSRSLGVAAGFELWVVELLEGHSVACPDNSGCRSAMVTPRRVTFHLIRKACIRVGL